MECREASQRLTVNCQMKRLLIALVAMVTPATGKRLIAKSFVSHPAIRTALQSGTGAETPWPVLCGNMDGGPYDRLLGLETLTH